MAHATVSALDLLSPEARAVLDAITSAPVAWPLLDELREAGHAEPTVEALVADGWLARWLKTASPRLDVTTGEWSIARTKTARGGRQSLGVDPRWKGVGGGWPRLTRRLSDGRVVRRVIRPPAATMKACERCKGIEVAITLTPLGLARLGLAVVESGPDDTPRFGTEAELPRFYRAPRLPHEAGPLEFPELLVDPDTDDELEAVLVDEVAGEPVTLWGRVIRLDPRLAKQRPKRKPKRKALAVGA